MNRYLDLLFSGRPTWFVVFAGFAMIALIGEIDYLSGYEVSFFIFYALPVMLVAWYCGTFLGYGLGVIAILTWICVDQASGHTYSHEWILFWNSAVRLIFFLLAAYLMADIRLRLMRESMLAHVDGLTGCLNAYTFNEKCDTLLPLSYRFRQPITLGFIDLDDFKHVNDTLGHSEGNRVLKAVAETMRGYIRKTDIVGRMGGDEFAILLPNTDLDNARIVFDDLRNRLLEDVRNNGWTTGFSIGVVVFFDHAISTDKAIGMADALMYRVKKGGKNNVIYEAVSGPDAL